MLWRYVRADCFSRQQGLQLLRWLAAAPRGVGKLIISTTSQGVSLPAARLARALDNQASALKHLWLQ